MLRIISIIALLAGVMMQADGQDEFKACLIKSAVTPPIIDGKFEDACWQNADRLGSFVKLGASVKAKEQTLFQAAYDSKNLYLCTRVKL